MSDHEAPEPEGTETVTVASENAIPSPESNDSRSHTMTQCPSEEVGQAVVQAVNTTEPASNNCHSRDQADTGHENSGRIEVTNTDSVNQRMNSESVLNEQVVTTEPTSSGAADQIFSEDARQANSDGTEIEMAVFRDQNVDHENVLNGSTLPELTRRDSPPSYERVMQERSAFITIQAPIATVEEVSTVTTPDNDTVTDVDVITTQPQSSIVDSSVVVDRDNTGNSDLDNVSDSDPELTATIEYLRRRRRERGNVEETECGDSLGLCFDCTACDSDEMKCFCAGLQICLLCTGTICLVCGACAN